MTQIPWKIIYECKHAGRKLYTAYQNKEGGLVTYPPLKFNAALRFMRKYAHIDVDKVLKGEQKMPND